MRTQVTTQTLAKVLRCGFAGLVIAGLLGVVGSGSTAAQTTKKTTTKAPAKTPAVKGAAKTGAGTGGGKPGAAGTGGVRANGAGSRGPTANGGGGMRAGGGAGHSAVGGSAPRGSNERVARNGSAVRTRADGRVSDVHDSRRGMDVHHGLGGGRRVSVDRPGHGRVYAERGRRGYVQAGYNYHGRDFGRRAYYYHGHEYNRYYRGYGYRGLYLNVYAPGFYYGPGFYGWAYNPWAVPISFGWGWAGSPWYGFYGGYFTPYAVYPSAAFWLTDYLLSQDLQAAYAAHQEAGEVDGAQDGPGGPPELTPDVKQQISDEVKGQLALENAEAQQSAQNQDVDPGSSGIARILADGRPHVFVAGDSLDVVDGNGQECAISDGDVLQLQSPPPPDATSANLLVLASKGGQECQKSGMVTVQLTDLQEMQNHMRETIDQGLQDLQAKQGKGGIPAAPPSAQAKPTTPEYASIAPPPDPQDAATIQQQDQQADQAEQEATSGTVGDAAAAVPVPGPAAQAAPASVELGQTPDQVKSALGQPSRVANLGVKVIYYFNGMKVTFKNGKVSDVE